MVFWVTGHTPCRIDRKSTVCHSVVRSSCTQLTHTPSFRGSDAHRYHLGSP
ncbi:hypothetical protein B0H17DRAFT_1100213, partial [Mycena rosella]